MDVYHSIRTTSSGEPVEKSMAWTRLVAYPVPCYTKHPAAQNYDDPSLLKSIESISISDDHQYAGDSGYPITFGLRDSYKTTCAQSHLGRQPIEAVSLARHTEDREQSDCDTASVIETDHDTTSYWRHGTGSPSVLSMSDGYCQRIPQTIACNESHEPHKISRLLDWVDSVMAAEGKQCKTDGRSGNSQPSSKTLNNIALSANDTSFSSVNSGKRPLDDDSEQDANESESDEDRRNSKRNRSTEERVGRFACPFFKRNTLKYMNIKTCAGPGWTDIRRIKEHLYRRHMLPRFQCHRCSSSFRNDMALSLHQKASTPCNRCEAEPHEGVTRDQERQLKQRKRNLSTEPEKWVEMYRILFPADDPATYPSPYYEYVQGTAKVDFIPRHNVEAGWGRDYVNFLRSGVSEELRRELNSRIENEFGIYPQEFKSQILDLTLSFQLRLFQEFQGRCDSTNLSQSGSYHEETVAIQNHSSSDIGSESGRPAPENPDHDDSRFYPNTGIVWGLDTSRIEPNIYGKENHHQVGLLQSILGPYPASGEFAPPVIESPDPVPRISLTPTDEPWNPIHCIADTDPPNFGAPFSSLSPNTPFLRTGSPSPSELSGNESPACSTTGGVRYLPPSPRESPIGLLRMHPRTPPIFGAYDFNNAGDGYPVQYSTSPGSTGSVSSISSVHGGQNIFPPPPMGHCLPYTTSSSSVAGSYKMMEPSPETSLQSKSYPCTFPGCAAIPFPTRYLLQSHTKVHSNDRPHYCPVTGCPHSEGGKGFKRKNEMIRHRLVHEPPGYACPFCLNREQKHPRPDILWRHVRAQHPGRDQDPQLREILSQRPRRGPRVVTLTQNIHQDSHSDTGI